MSLGGPWNHPWHFVGGPMILSRRHSGVISVNSAWGWVIRFLQFDLKVHVRGVMNHIHWSNFIATSHDRFPPNGRLVREIPLFQGNLGWWNIIIWPDIHLQKTYGEFWKTCHTFLGFFFSRKKLGLVLWNSRSKKTPTYPWTTPQVLNHLFTIRKSFHICIVGDFGAMFQGSGMGFS